MFDIASSELLIVALVALLVIGPKDLPRVLRMVGNWLGKARRVASQFRSGFDEMVRQSELEELEQKWAAENARIMAEHPPTREYDSEPPPAMTALPTQPVPEEAVAATPRKAPAQEGGTGMNEIDESKMPLLDHLIELRNRLLWCVLALAIAFGVCFYFAHPIYGWLVQPLKNVGQDKLIYTDIFEAFFVQVKVGLFAALMVSFPVFATQIYRFVAPGLYRNEKKAFLPFLLMTPILFTLGASLAYFGAMPVALKFLLGFQGDVGGGVTQEALPGVGNYLNFATTFIFGFGVAFQLPVLLMLLERAGIVSRDQLKAGRRYAIVGAFVIAAVLTPPDVVSQLLLAIPLCLLYELAIIAIWFTQKRREKMVSEEEAATESEAT